MALISWISYYILIPVGLVIIIYLYLTRNYGYWSNLGVPEVPPTLFTGSIGLDFMTPTGKREQKWYKKYGSVFGIYEGANPVLMVAEPKLLKNILIKDFQSFTDLRTLQFGDPIIDRMLFVQTGKKWREMKAILSPAFTSRKMKMISTSVSDCAQTLVDNILEAAEGVDIDIDRYFSAYLTDVIASCVFGMKLDESDNPSNPFVKAVKDSISPIPWRVYISIFFPGLAKFLRLSFFNPSTSMFFKKVILEVISRRENLKDEEKPNDILQSLLDLKNQNKSGKPEKSSNLELEDIVAQCIMIFIAGYIATKATFLFAVHELAVNPEIQEKLIKEIDHTFKNKDIDYDTIVGMEYLEAIVQETLRLYTPSPRLERTSTKSYVLGNTGIMIPKGILVAIPIYAISHDPLYFPDPDKFIPERFLKENKEKLYPYTNMPFGAGLRLCLGMKLATLQIKMALIKILQRAKFKLGNNTKEEPEFDALNGLHCPKNVLLNIEGRKNKNKTKKFSLFKKDRSNIENEK